MWLAAVLLKVNRGCMACRDTNLYSIGLILTPPDVNLPCPGMLDIRIYIPERSPKLPPHTVRQTEPSKPDALTVQPRRS